MTDLEIRQERKGRAPDHTLLKGTLHKTSNGLCGIKGYASLLAYPERADEDSRHWARKILDEVSRLEEIFRSVAALTPEPRSPEAGVDVASMARDLAVRTFEHCADVELEVGELPSGEILLPVADLRLILTEVLANARDCREGEHTRIRVTVTGEINDRDRVEIAVADDGPGLHEAVTGRATEPFVTTREGRLGVGLTRVETLMGLYGLAWALDSVPGGGVTVRLELAEAWG